MENLNTMNINEMIKLAQSSSNIDLLNILSVDKNEQIRSAVVSNPNVSMEIVENILHYEQSDLVKLTILKEFDCSYSMLETLSKDDNPEIRAKVGSLVNVPFEILEELSFDEDDSVKIELAKNLQCPDEILEDLTLNNSNIEILKAVASNVFCPDEILERLSKKIELQDTVISNEYCPEYIITNLKINDIKNKNISYFQKQLLISSIV